ncbi:MAG: energy-coupling factor transporter ATPase [Eubacteriales bacterium]|nr:energy-coupling factor transporter ATPase [Eubacteriales bacterium]
MIRTENLCFFYKEGKYVLDHVNIHIKKGEFVAILGHNGSGKSTLAKHFNALLMPMEGKVYSGGFDTSVEESIFDVRQKIGMVFQNPDNQIVAAVVEEDVAFAAENLGVPSEEIRERVDWALSVVGLSDFTTYAPHLLSGGQKQKVAIAGILAMKPECIVLDEPTAMLDPKGRRDVMRTLRKLNKDGITIVLVTHNMDEAVQADRVIVMSEGKIAQKGTPREIFSQVEAVRLLGLDVPQVTELMYELGLESVMNVDEAYEVLKDKLLNS